jgi:hypothetical protein
MGLDDWLDDIEEQIREGVKPRASEGYIAGPEDDLFVLYENIALEMESITGSLFDELPELRVWYSAPESGGPSMDLASRSVSIPYDDDEKASEMAEQLASFMRKQGGSANVLEDLYRKGCELVDPEGDDYLDRGFDAWLAERAIDRSDHGVTYSMPSYEEDPERYVGAIVFRSIEEAFDQSEAVDVGISDRSLEPEQALDFVADADISREEKRAVCHYFTRRYTI